MKKSSKPLSSPGRTEKFPPPLMRFLRSNVGNRSRSSSRGRSRASPMFVRKKNKGIENTQQEPSSPKVTCMGQVRVRRTSKQSSTSNRRSRTPAKHRCQWVKDAFFCANLGPLGEKIKEISLRPLFRKWVVFFQKGLRRKAENSSKNERNENSFNHKESENEAEKDELAARANKFVYPSSTTPPKNALLLTRCRSAPYRSSSLASQFWGSPLTTEKSEQETEYENRESIYRASNAESRNDLGSEESMRLCGDVEDSVDEHSTKSAKFKELKTREACFDRPLMLTRCKSEPALPRDILDPDDSFWRNRRFGLTCSNSPQACD